LFPSRFGPNSFVQHLDESERCGARVKILRNANIERDVDEWDDFHALLGRTRPGSAIARWMAEYSFVSGTNPCPRAE
jgi:2-phospho-L-lactate guanylyltransferase (CobY/MobA/RfbA family)